MFVPVPATIDFNYPTTVVVVDTPASHDGEPIEVKPGVKLQMTDGFTVVMGQHEAEIAVTPTTESEEAYNYRMCMDLQEARPWIDWGCVNVAS